MQVPIQLSQLQLMAVYSSSLSTSSTSLSNSSNSISPTGLNNSGNLQQQTQEEVEGFEAKKIELVMGGSELKKINLSLMPLKEGLLSIQGISFVVGGQIQGMRKFDNGMKKNLSTSQLADKKIIANPTSDLNVKITSPMPLMEVELKKFPSTLYQGQVHKLQVDFKNTGKSALQNVYVKMSHPSFFSFAASNFNNPAALFVREATPTPFSSSPTNNNNNEEKEMSVSKIPIQKLEAGESVSVVMWIRAHKIGSFSLHFLWHYQSCIPNPDMKYRLQRITKHIRVIPSIKPSFLSNISYSNVNAHLIKLEVKKKKLCCVFYLFI